MYYKLLSKFLVFPLLTPVILPSNRIPSILEGAGCLASGCCGYNSIVSPTTPVISSVTQLITSTIEVSKNNLLASGATWLYVFTEHVMCLYMIR